MGLNLYNLARFFSGSLDTWSRLEIGDFIQVIESEFPDIGAWNLSSNRLRYAASPTEFYSSVLSSIAGSVDGEEKVLAIANRFGWSNWIKGYSYKSWIGSGAETYKNEQLKKEKSEFSTFFSESLKEIDALIKNSKEQWNRFEDICEKFLLKSEFFLPGFREFEFSDDTEKIDRLLRLKRHVWSFLKETTSLWYAILEAKYKNFKESASGNEITPKLGNSEAVQLLSYINRLQKFGISHYAITIVSSDAKETYKTKLKSIADKAKDGTPFFISLITVDEIKEFLSDSGRYEWMGFDEFIERSFISWLPSST